MMHGGSGVANNKEKEEQEETISTPCNLPHRSIMVAAVVLRPPCGPTPSAKAKQQLACMLRKEHTTLKLKKYHY
jgi:hypothetical protein